ncbi:MAG: IS66 family insertion sequence element accessory protein TnpB [Lachnospiraceae bacterium]|nr:IS66 family insertion sequence element accessory protein TnpB [Lachnospiraceae bacterium]MBQ5633029.1 IS66 family insertion sequence element accessory protein TnpB [Treponema sp.]MBQ5647213.1 IS66 family insertion sequence element accessory protein TnpB [Treponema sp.]
MHVRNGQRKHLKLVWWDTNGFWTAQKVLEKGQWPWPDTAEDAYADTSLRCLEKKNEKTS